MIRKEYWEKAQELIEFCNEEELNVLIQQSTKALNKRMDTYLKKVKIDDDHKKKVRARKIKSHFKSKGKKL